MSATTQTLAQGGPKPDARTRSQAAAAKAKRLKVLLKMEPVDPAHWDATVADFDGICEGQIHAFASRRWPSVEIEPRLFYNGKKPVAAALVMIQKLPLGVGSIALVKSGPILRDEAAHDAKAIYGQAIDQLVGEYAEKRGMMLSVMANAPRNEKSECFAFLLARRFRQGSQLLFPKRYMVNLELSLEEQRKSFAQKWRYHLNKSEKNDLVFEHAGADKLAEFDKLYRAMTERKRFPDYSAYDTVPHLMANEAKALRPELFFVRHKGELVAGAVIFTAGKTAVYLYGATSDEALPLRAGYFLHWHIIEWLKKNTRADWYDLGGTDGFQGLHQFKKGMVGAKGVISDMPPVANYAANSWAYLMGTGAYAARDSVQKARRFLNWMRHDMARPNQGR